ncbi:rhomboid family intramembrane serine protease [Halomontanus rarus]|uniref:rhomboid family intramembrane serine protease n=1 Tax=Halomontanus rarus TaxID=3034020 RepID=UPI0023E8E08E|nr:rhomboid family intramembrane serine protease [Halovivax sp. TS33]
MAKCDVCGKDESMPYNCRHCGGTYCGEHRLPENHDCTGLQNWNDPSGVFDSGFDDSVNDSGTSRASSITSKLPIDTGPGGPLAYFRGNMTYTFLALMWVTFLAQMIAGVALSRQTQLSIFYFTTFNPEYVWTWFISVFSHGGLMHIVFNSIVIFFFGPLVERYVGSRNFGILFVVSGVLAGMGQIGISLVQSEPAAVLGASGAALAIMGVLTVLNPSLKVYLYFILPVPLWLLTIGTAVVSLAFIGGGAAGGGGIAHAAHLVGLLIGLAYGEYIKRTRNVRTPNQFQLGGGGPGGPGGPGRGRGPF